MNRTFLIALGVTAVAAASGAYFAFQGMGTQAETPLRLEVWHGHAQRVGQHGNAQPDFNLMGIAGGREAWVSVNGGKARELTIGASQFGFRRLGAEGHFNADIPIAALEPGTNEVHVVASGSEGSLEETITLEYVLDGSCPLPHSVDWSELDHVQSAGQAVDGLWELDGDGVRSREPLYDRLFLIGNRDEWHDYEVRTTITVHDVAAETAPKSGAPGVGVIMRFAGHVVDPPRFPDAQPKWGFQPIGAILWLRWTSGADEAPVRQFYRGDRNESDDFMAFDAFRDGRAFALRAACETSASDPNLTTYRLKVWPVRTAEPDGWDFEVEQSSAEALRSGGVALVAHHVDVTFGDVSAR